MGKKMNAEALTKISILKMFANLVIIRLKQSLLKRANFVSPSVDIIKFFSLTDMYPVVI